MKPQISMLLTWDRFVHKGFASIILHTVLHCYNIVTYHSLGSYIFCYIVPSTLIETLVVHCSMPECLALQGFERRAWLQSSSQRSVSHSVARALALNFLRSHDYPFSQLLRPPTRQYRIFPVILLCSTTIGRNTQHGGGSEC